MSSNIEVLARLDRLTKLVKNGRVSLDFTIHKNEIKSVQAKTRVKNLYNQSSEDVHNNMTAMEHIIRMVKSHLESKSDRDLNIKLRPDNSGKIKSVEFEKEEVVKT